MTTKEKLILQHEMEEANRRHVQEWREEMKEEEEHAV